ncbi:MAG: hypothetical protein OEP95_04325 [Myxococcales bacterium]|nr:hypothetical protein [Myxococcales bacterium]
MQPEYEMVMELTSFAWTLIPMLLHGLTLAAQGILGAALVASGIALLLSPDHLLPGLGALAAPRPESVGARRFGRLQIGAGVLVLAPLSLGWPWLASAAGCVGAIALLWVSGRGIFRALALAAAALTLLFMAWERDDPATLAARILFKAQEWRTHELEWQLANDVRSPKVGDLAPDFELQDPSGEETIRLSSFRGKRPVALVFGSYT